MSTPAESPKPPPDTVAKFAHLTRDQAKEAIAWIWEIINDPDAGPHQDRIDAIDGVLNEAKDTSRPRPKLHIFTYDPDDGDFFIAESPEEADALFTAWMGQTVAQVTEGDEDHSWTPIPDDKVFKVHFEEDDHGPDRHEHELPAFFVEKYGKGYLCSRNY